MPRILAPLLIGLGGIAILVWLGTWQIQRSTWKQGILDQIETKISGPAQPLPSLISPDDQRYMPVQLNGTFGPGELHVLVSIKRQGAGWRVISDYTTNDGRRLLVDRGFTPVDQKDTQRLTGDAEVLGNLHWPDDRNSSTPQNDLAKNNWYARDIAAMAEALETEPLLVIARNVAPADPSLTPLPVDTRGIPNDHMQYAGTWFSLAAAWLLMTGLWIRRRLTGKDS